MRLTFFTLLSVFLVGCSTHFTEEKLVGKYVLSVGAGTDVIQLKNDGTYIHSFQNKEGSMATQNGKWALESLDAGPTVTLNNFQSLSGMKVEDQGFYLLKISSFFGKITLITDQDLNQGYIKSTPAY